MTTSKSMLLDISDKKNQLENIRDAIKIQILEKHFDNDEHFHWEHTKDGRPPTYPDSMRDQMIKDFEDYTKRGKYHFVNKTDIDFMNDDNYKRMIFSFVLLVCNEGYERP
mgnify:CR=1 FL=1